MKYSIVSPSDGQVMASKTGMIGCSPSTSRIGNTKSTAQQFGCVCLLLMLSGCDPSTSESPKGSDQVEPKPANILIFPVDYYAKDETVNTFVRRAMADCASGDYQKFRLLWSAREEPLPRGEYDQGWQAVQEIRIRVLQEVILAADPQRGRQEDQTVYGLAADVSLDPAHRAGRKEPSREVVLMVVSEQGSWRLARPPQDMRNWIKQRATSNDEKKVIAKTRPIERGRVNKP
jgi:hypothetical protein